MMFRKKKTEQSKSKLDNCKEIFDKYQKEDYEEKKLVELLYKKIKNDYEELLRSGKLDIHLERIRINNSLDKYNDTTNRNKELNKAFNLICMTAIFNVIIKIVESVPNVTNLDEMLLPWIKFIFYILLLFYLVYIMGDFTKFIEKHKNVQKDLVNNISLIVLDDIEKELNEDVSSESETQKDIKSKGINVKGTKSKRT